jgi:two-component system, OmpR family, sensor histidine kinase KdpD
VSEPARPDPDALLARLQADDAQARRGRLKIFFGASAGVGKTYAMLAAGRAAQAQGTALAIGVVETHGRSETAAMLRDLPRLALREVVHRERTLLEFDLDAALAFGKQHADALVLVDELAHSNAAGSRHPKRWQDVQELLAAGIDVWSTMNVQHLESLNDIVSGITGIRVWETVPDRVFDEADEVVVVDLPPDELLLRLKQGKVYLPQQAERAAANFFRKGNLLALRELALRRTADRVDDQMLAWRKRSAVQAVWPNREALLACVGPGDHGEKVARSCARLAAQLDVPWHAVHVERPGHSEAQRQPALRVLKLAQELGATTATLSAGATTATLSAGADVPEALIRYAREHNLSRVVLGRTERRWRWPWRVSLAEALTTRVDELDVLQVALPTAPTGRDAAAASPAVTEAAAAPWRWRGYAAAAAVCGATALVATPLLGIFELTNIVMLFLLAVVGVALRFGRGPAVLAAFLGVALFDFFFVPPRFDFAVSDVQYLVTFAVMLVVALVIGQLTAGLKVQAEAAIQREHRVRSLYDMSRDLSAALMPEQVAEIGARFIGAEFGAKCTLLVAGLDDRWAALPGGSAAVDLGVAQWAFDRAAPAGRGTDTLPGSACLMLPLKAPMRLRGVVAIEPAAGREARLLGPEPRRLLETCASLLAISLERIHYIEVAQASTVQIESERLRNSLLSAISHDLRTPLAALVGLADTLQLTQPALDPAPAGIARAMRDSALRMNALVGNLLDMARLQAGAVRLDKQWQPLEEVVGSALGVSADALAEHPLTVSLPDDLPLLHLDAVLMERVLVNLFENAAKYTPAGTHVAVRAALNGGDAVELIVEDEGPGLPSGREEAIFDKFERGKKESATAGVGLGLAICRAIVEAHGGRIRAEQRGGGKTGARFVITLPRGRPPSDTGAEGALPADRTAEAAS